MRFIDYKDIILVYLEKNINYDIYNIYNLLFLSRIFSIDFLKQTFIPLVTSFLTLHIIIINKYNK